MSDKLPSVRVRLDQSLTSTKAKPRIPFDGCPLCASRDIAAHRRGNCSRHPLYHPFVEPIMVWMACRTCEHVFTQGYFSSEVSDAVFGKTHDQQKPGLGFEQHRLISGRIVQEVARHASGGRWLDVGFGNGSLLFTAEEFGFEPVGVDLRASSVEEMQRLGFEAHCVDIAAFGQDGNFSVISMADVLEHMPFPKQGLEAAHRLLKPGGVLFVSMPNYNCAAWRLADRAKANPFWSEIEHYHNFSRQRLQALLQEMGFEPRSYRVSERYRLCMELIAERRPA